tara:strand:- start:34 stop:654 length:621 start_codon:yes stop_codon:yes gene_type:complete
MKHYITEAKIEDIYMLTSLHLNNYHSNELSMQLGENFISELYRLCIEQANVSILILKRDIQIQGVSVVFFHFSEFEKIFMRRMIFRLSNRLLNLLLERKWKKFLSLIRTAISLNFKKYVPKRIYNYHIGSLILDKQQRSDPMTLVLFERMFTKNIEILQSKATDGIWGSCYESNTPSFNFMKGKGLNENILCNAYPERVYVNIKRF